MAAGGAQGLGDTRRGAPHLFRLLDLTQKSLHRIVLGAHLDEVSLILSQVGFEGG